MVVHERRDSLKVIDFKFPAVNTSYFVACLILFCGRGRTCGNKHDTIAGMPVSMYFFQIFSQLVVPIFSYAICKNCDSSSGFIKPYPVTPLSFMSPQRLVILLALPQLH